MPNQILTKYRPTPIPKVKIDGIENLSIKKKMNKRIGSMLGSRLKMNGKKSSTVMLGADISERSGLLGGSLKLNSGRSILDDGTETQLSPNESHRSAVSHQKSSPTRSKKSSVSKMTKKSKKSKSKEDDSVLSARFKPFPIA